MNTIRDKKRQIFGLFIVFVIIDVILIVYSRNIYVGAHKFYWIHLESVLTILITIGIYFYLSLFRHTRYRFRKIIMWVFILFILVSPLLIILTRPPVRYDEGFSRIISEYPEFENYELIDLEGSHRTAPSMDENKILNILKFTQYGRIYYYVLEYKDSEDYFIVDPYGDFIRKLDERYWNLP